jgi:hypothetical protein
MRVLLMEGAERATAETILVLPGFVETVWAPLLPSVHYRGVCPEGCIAGVGVGVVARAIATACDHRHPIVSSARLFNELSWMHRKLRPYVIGSRIRLEVTSFGCALDCSKAVFTTEAYARRGPWDEGL